MTLQDDDVPLDEAQAAALAGCARATLAKMRREGRAPAHYMLGARVRYTRAAVMAWRAAQTQRSGAGGER